MNSLLSFRNGGGLGSADDLAMVVLLLVCLFDCELIEIVRIGRDWHLRRKWIGNLLAVDWIVG